MKSNLILDIIRSHSEGEEAFRQAVERLASDEDRKGNSALALEIRKAARGQRAHYDEERGGMATVQSADTVPDPELITLMEPDVSLDDLILDDDVRDRLGEVIDEWRCRDRLPEGIGPTTRLLFTGPPGCGKTVTAKAVARALGMDVAYVRLDGLISQFMGQTGANIRRIFDEASRMGALLFLDEFDAVAKTRADSLDVGESKRVITALLQNMDLHADDVMVIAATNMPELIDPAVARRFDLVLGFGRPDASRRERMIESYASDHGLSNDIDLGAFVGCTAGMSYAEIETVLRSMIRYVSVNDVRSELDAAFIRGFLGPDGRSVTEMRMSGMSVNDIVSVTGMPRSTVYYKLKRGERSGNQGWTVLDNRREPRCRGSHRQSRD